MRELDRGGQVFYLHNRVESIYHVAEHLRQLVPHARDHDRARADGRARARARDAGLLHGEVAGPGVHDHHRERARHPERQHHDRERRRPARAGAALPVAGPRRALEPAGLRLSDVDAVQAADRDGGEAHRRDPRVLRAGLRVQDGAARPGDHGARATFSARSSTASSTAVGFELYMQMLSDAVQEAKGEAPVSRPEVSVDLPVDAYLPPDYAPDLNQRIDLYRRLASAPDCGRVEMLEGEIGDRYGQPAARAGAEPGAAVAAEGTLRGRGRAGHRHRGQPGHAAAGGGPDGSRLRWRRSSSAGSSRRSESGWP